MQIIFMGTSEFAIPSLFKLHYSLHNIAAVITRPDRPKGRGKILLQSKIKNKAIKLGYKVLQPETINSKVFIQKLKNYNPDLFVVLAFGEILKKTLLNVPKKGSVNVHPSLIPKYRGPAPIQWSIINGEKKTGVTTMLMNSGMDSGRILMNKITNINACETSSCLEDRLSKIGSELLIKSINKIEDETIKSIPQNINEVSFAPIIQKKNGEINWNNNADKIERFIRGMHPWPGAFTFYNRIRLKIIKATIINKHTNKLPGTILKNNSDKLYIATKKKIISINIIQNEAGKILPIDSFLNGFKLNSYNSMGK